MSTEMSGLYIPNPSRAPHRSGSDGYSIGLLTSITPVPSGILLSAVFGAYISHIDLEIAAVSQGVAFDGKCDVGLLQGIDARAIYGGGGAEVVFGYAFTDETQTAQDALRRTAVDVIGIARCMVIGCLGVGTIDPTTEGASLTTWDVGLDVDLPFYIGSPGPLVGTMGKTSKHNVNDTI